MHPEHAGPCDINEMLPKQAPDVYRRRDPSGYTVTYLHKIPNSIILNSVVSHIVVRRKRKSDIDVYI